MSVSEYKNMLRIDKDNLDTELASNPFLTFDVSENYTDAVAERDQAKMYMDSMYSDTQGKVISKNDKLAQWKVEAEINLGTKYRAAKAEYMELKIECEIWFNLMQAFEMRSRALTKLADLASIHYYTTGNSGASDRIPVRPREANKKIKRKRQNDFT